MVLLVSFIMWKIKFYMAILTLYRNMKKYLIILMVTLLQSCATSPPVQELSDARQAIAVAREAGASEHAPGVLKAAETYLDSALRNLAKKEYELAKLDAIEAKKDALNALAVAASSSDKSN